MSGTTGFLPPDPSRHESPEGHDTKTWTPENVFGGLCVLSITVTVCLVVLDLVGVIG